MNLRILLVDDETSARYALRKALGTHHELKESADGEAALQAIQEFEPDLVFLDLNMPKQDGLGVLRALQGRRPFPQIVVVTANDAIEPAVESIRLGASDYITKPYEVTKIRAIARQVSDRVALQRQVQTLQAERDQSRSFGTMLGISRSMRQLFEQVERASRAPGDVLIRGETGTGKELVAREIHRRSTRSSGPFIAVNTAAINDSLIESELFGHIKGAFTGADGDRKGCFEQADGGILFLDEVGDMPASAQTKMLRVLQERVVVPVGTSKPRSIDVRVVSATHQDLESAIEQKQFRADLFYRLKGIELRIPPLRQRREDVLLLAEHFLEQSASAMGEPAKTFNGAAVDRLLTYEWPGNVRELQQCVSSAVSMSAELEISAGDLHLSPTTSPVDEIAFGEWIHLPLVEGKARLVEAFERAAITQALEAEQGNITAAARRLGMHRQNLQQKMQQLGLRH